MKLRLLFWVLFVGFLVTFDQILKFFSGADYQLNLVGAGSFVFFRTNKIFWLILTGVILFGLAIYILKSSQLTKKTWLAWALVWGGGLANWLDRLIYGGVRDIWPIYGTNLKNNFADYALTFGIIWLMIDELRKSTQKPEKFL